MAGAGGGGEEVVGGGGMGMVKSSPTVQNKGDDILDLIDDCTS